MTNSLPVRWAKRPAHRRTEAIDITPVAASIPNRMMPIAATATGRLKEWAPMGSRKDNVTVS
jgi:hypothetical protein